MQVEGTRMYRVREIAGLVDMSPSTVYRAIAAGALDASRFGSAVRVPGSAVAAWLAACASASAEQAEVTR